MQNVNKNKIELEQMRNELAKIQKRQRIDTKRFLEWNSDELVDWIVTIQNGQFSKYEKILQVTFKKEGVNGSTLEHIDKAELRGWGVESFMDRINMYKHIQSLFNQNQQKQIANEEGGNYHGTDYI